MHLSKNVFNINKMKTNKKEKMELILFSSIIQIYILEKPHLYLVIHYNIKFII